MEKWEKAWYNSYIIKSQGGLNHDVMWIPFSNYGNVPTHQNSHWVKVAQSNSASLLVYSYDTEDSTLDAHWTVMQ